MTSRVLSIIALLISGCATRQPDLIQTPDFWTSTAAKELDERIMWETPPELLQHLEEDNAAHGWVERPKAAHLTPEERDLISSALATIPECVKSTLEQVLYGIAFVDELGGSGYTSKVRWKNGRPIGAFMVFDRNVLRKSANEWMTYKESSPFAPEPGYSLEGIIEKKKNSTPANAFQYIFLHEAGHALASVRSDLPFYEMPHAEHVEAQTPNGYDSLSWKLEGQHFVSESDSFWPERKEIKYYSQARKNPIPLSQASRQYDLLSKTKFPSLYGATDVAEDFAEAFVTYVHTKLQHRPWKIVIHEPSGIKTYKDCWNQKRCREKRQRLEKILSCGSH